MDEFPEFMQHPANRIATTDQATQGVEGYVFDGAEGERLFSIVIQLDPRDALIRQLTAAFLTCASRHKEAWQQVKESLRIEPLSAMYQVNGAMMLLLAGQCDAAIRQLRQALDLEALFPVAHLWLAWPTQ